METWLRKGSSCHQQETYHCHRALREDRRGRKGHERSFRARRQINRNNRSIRMLPKLEQKAGILSVLCMQIAFSRRKKTCLMFFGSSQANSTATSSSHIIIFCPAEQENHKAPVSTQASRSLPPIATQHNIRHLACLALSSVVPYS